MAYIIENTGLNFEELNIAIEEKITYRTSTNLLLDLRLSKSPVPNVVYLDRVYKAKETYNVTDDGLYLFFRQDNILKIGIKQ